MTAENTNSSTLKFAVLATDVVCFQITNNKLYVLLGKVTTVPAFKDKWALIGGLIRPEETAEKSVERHLIDKAGIAYVFKEQLYTFSSIDRDPRGRVVSVAYMALTHKDSQDLKKAQTETRWCLLNEVPTLAYDHNEILKVAVERLRTKVAYSNISQYLLPKEFTMTELQMIYECILNRVVDKRNFRKKIIASNMLKETKHTRKEGVMRPAALYEFSNKNIESLNIL